MAYYFPSSSPVTKDIAQLERWLRDEFLSVQAGTNLAARIDAFFAAANVVAGYGGIGLDAITALSDINATPQILPFDIELITDPRGVDYNLGSQALQFAEVGVWRMNAKVSLEFLELNAGRRMELRLYNVATASDVGPTFNFSVGRNTDGVNLNFNLLVNIPEEILNDPLVLRVRSAADTFTGVQAIGSIWDANLVSEYKGDFFDREIGTKSRWP